MTETQEVDLNERVRGGGGYCAESAVSWRRVVVL